MCINARECEEPIETVMFIRIAWGRAETIIDGDNWQAIEMVCEFAGTRGETHKAWNDVFYTVWTIRCPTCQQIAVVSHIMKQFVGKKVDFSYEIYKMDDLDWDSTHEMEMREKDKE